MFHWYTDFKPIRDFIHISFISLILSVIIGIGADMIHEVPMELKELNNKIWVFMFILHCLVGFSVDSYIIFF